MEVMWYFLIFYFQENSGIRLIYLEITLSTLIEDELVSPPPR